MASIRERVEELQKYQSGILMHPSRRGTYLRVTDVAELANELDATIAEVAKLLPGIHEMLNRIEKRKGKDNHE
jgi:hypothetical protein